MFVRLPAQSAVLAGVNGHQENLQQSVALLALACRRFSFCLFTSAYKDSQMWQRNTLPLLAEMALAIHKESRRLYKARAWWTERTLDCVGMASSANSWGLV